MQTLADLKRRIKVGTKIRKVAHINNGVEQIPAHPSGVREVMKVQSKGWGISFPNKANHQKNALSWLDIPKASELEFDGNRFTITTWGGTLQMTYEIVE